MSDFSSFLSIRTLTDALKAKLEKIQWIRGGKSEPAFQKVAPFDVRDIAVALADLAIVGDRVCLIVLSGEEFDTQVEGTDLLVSHRVPFTLLLADRNYGDRQSSFFGDNRTAGAVTLRDLVLGLDAQGCASFLGCLFPEGTPRQVRIEPTDGEPFILTEKQREKLGGIAVWAVNCVAVGGSLQISLGRYPVN